MFNYEIRDILDTLEHYLHKSLKINYKVQKDDFSFDTPQPEKPKNLVVLEKEPKRKIYNQNTKPKLIIQKAPSKPLITDKKYNKQSNTGNIVSIVLLFCCAPFVFFFSHLLNVLYNFSIFGCFVLGLFIVNIFTQLFMDIFNKVKNTIKYKSDLKHWQKECILIVEINKKNKLQHTLEMNKWNQNKQKEYREKLDNWNCKKNAFYNNIDILLQKYHNGEIDGLFFIIQQSLKRMPSIYTHTNKYILNYDHENNILAVNYFLPDFEKMKKLPKERERYSSKVTYYSDRFMKKLYNNLIYEIIFSAVHAIFSVDTDKIIQSIIINGYVETIDLSTGKEKVICLCSLQIHRNDYEDLNLKQIDAQLCFKYLKGITTMHLENKIPVRPLLNLDTNDKRFVESYAVAQHINDKTNLAAMNWQDFENLIRELFEKKFSKNGGECKVTQVSRDGGVDAIAFDPDPILGGKIIIQAKRYTNTVGVSAVRDLYGTLINEGANKGILITTSDYGTEAHNFAKDKPLILLNGNNLLHLLQEEMSITAYIDIEEAKKTTSQ